MNGVLEDNDYPEAKIREAFGDTAAVAVLRLVHKGKLDKEGHSRKVCQSEGKL